MAGGEAFPKLVIESQASSSLPAVEPRPRKHSSLGGDIRAGSTAPAVATWDVPPSPMTPVAPRDERKKSGAKRRKARTLARRVKKYALKHTWVIPLVLLAVFGLLYAVNPSETNPIHHFIFLSYRVEPGPGVPDDGRPFYAKGRWDFAFVSFYTIVLSFTREFIMQTILRPLARKGGLKSRAKQSRFMEQAYTAIYFAFLGPVGLWIMKGTPLWYFNTTAMYEYFPHKLHHADFKFYYLFQAAYWAQQAIVLMLGMEKPRKDFKELVAHHIVSLALIFLSYRFHFTYIGIAVYITHDISDFFLAVSKTLNYVDQLPIPFFATFIAAWLYLRHYLNIKILISILTEFRTVGPYELNWETEQYKCWISFLVTFSLLLCLQCLNLFWLYYILRIAWRFLTLNVKEDDRSDDEGDDEEEEPLVPETNGHANGQANGTANGHSTGVESSSAAKRK